MKSFKDIRTNINEVLTKADALEKWISDFVHSDNPKFAGKSKEERIKMAKGAYYAAQKERAVKEHIVTEDTVTYTHKDTGAKMKSKNLTDVGAKSLSMQLKMQQHKDVQHVKEGENKQMKGKDPCWKGYQMVGTKKKNGREVPNCVPEESEIPLSDKEKNKMLSNKDKSTLGKIHSLMQKQKKEGYKSDAQRKAVWASRNEEADQIDEISKKTLASYVHHAAHDAGIKRIMSTDFYHQGDKAKKQSNKNASYKLAQKYKDKAIKRVDNIGKAAQKLAKEAVNPEAAAKESKKAQMAAKHAGEKEALAKKHEREKESMKESSASKLVQTKLGNMDRKNVRIPSPAERRAEMEKRKQMQKEDTHMLSFDEYLEEDMRIAKASSFAKKHAGDMKTAVKKIEGIRKGLANHPKVMAALKKANEELSAKQKKLDHNKNGKIDGDDLAKVRAGKTVNELDKSTLKSYADKAHQASQDHTYDAEHQYNDKKAQEKSRQMAAKRAAGVAKADAKLKEEENLDELSKKTLGSYVKKASFNAAQAAYQAGGSGGRIDKLQPHMNKLNKRTAGVNKATDKLTKEEVESEETYSSKSYKDFVAEMDSSKRYVHKGTRYGGSAQHDDEHESDFGRDHEDKEKYKQRLFGKPAKKKPAETPVKRGRGRPSGSKSGARDYYNKK